MEKITLTIKEILEGRRLITRQEIKKNMGKEESRQNISRLVRVTKRGTVSEDETMQWYHFEMGGIPCVYVFPEKKFSKILKKMKAPVLTLEEALEGRRQVTLDEIRAYTGKKNVRMSITQMVEITNQGISESGVRWYHFDMDGIPCVYKAPNKKWREPAKKMKKEVMTLEEALEGRRQVTLDEVRIYTGKCEANKRYRTGIRASVEITNQGITKDGLVKWYHFEMGGVPCVYAIKRLTVNNDNKMTEQERKFAEDNMLLFYKFFSLKGFDKEEFYDAAMNGYLKSVIKYHRDDVARKCKFSTVAYKAMIQKCIVHRRRILQEAKCISIEKMREEGKENWLLYGYANGHKPEKDMLQEVMKDIEPYINKQQRKMLMLIHAGYNISEIKKICEWKDEEARGIRNRIIETAKSYYSKAI